MESNLIGFSWLLYAKVSFITMILYLIFIFPGRLQEKILKFEFFGAEFFLYLISYPLLGYSPIFLGVYLHGGELSLSIAALYFVTGICMMMFLVFLEEFIKKKKKTRI